MIIIFVWRPLQLVFHLLIYIPGWPRDPPGFGDDDGDDDDGDVDDGGDDDGDDDDND